MYGYQVVFEDPASRRKRSVLQILSPRRYASVVELLRAEKLYRQYREWRLVDFQVTNSADPEPARVRVIDELPKPGSICNLVA